jgi:hypothetical protein
MEGGLCVAGDRAKVGRGLAVHVAKQGAEGSVWGEGEERIGCACGKIGC